MGSPGAGYTVRYVGSVCSVNVRFSATATASVGTWAAPPVTVRSNVVRAASGPTAPRPMRVSRMRVGATDRRPPEGPAVSGGASRTFSSWSSVPIMIFGCRVGSSHPMIDTSELSAIDTQPDVGLPLSAWRKMALPLPTTMSAPRLKSMTTAWL